MPCLLSSSSGPMPLSSRICGVLIAPPLRITSLRACTWKSSPPRLVWNSTPITVGVWSLSRSMSRRVTCAPHAMVRLGRLRTPGVKYAVAKEDRWPLGSMNVCNRVAPKVPSGVLISAVAGIPASSHAGRNPLSPISDSHEYPVSQWPLPPRCLASMAGRAALGVNRSMARR